MGLKPSAYREEEQRVKQLLETALSSLKEAMSSEVWPYTREGKRGKLVDVAKSILRSAIEELDY